MVKRLFSSCRLGIPLAFYVAGIYPMQVNAVYAMEPWNDMSLLANNLTVTKDPFPTALPKFEPVVKPLSNEKLDELLDKRVSAGFYDRFGAFSNMFVVLSKIELGTLVGLVTDSEEIENKVLESPFPKSYKATLRELLDSIAIQTRSAWHYNPTGHFVRTDSKAEKPMEGIAIFEFMKAERKKPYEFSLANGWRSEDFGNWVKCAPASAPVGMDIYEMGRYSCDDKADESKLLNKIPFDVALAWARQVKRDAGDADVKREKIGPYETCFFETILPSKLGKDVHWRHWVFMSGNRCFLVLSTLMLESDKVLLPDVLSMIKSIKVVESGNEKGTR